MRPIPELSPLDVQVLCEMRGGELLKTAAAAASLRTRLRRAYETILRLRAQRNRARRANARLSDELARVRREADAVLDELRGTNRRLSAGGSR